MGKHIRLDRPGVDELVILVDILECSANVQKLVRGENVASSPLPNAEFVDVSEISTSPMRTR